MNHKVIKIYFNPLIMIVISVLPWWALFKFVLKIDLNTLLGEHLTQNNIIPPNVFLTSVIIAAYILGVVFTFWIERSENNKERDKRVEKFFRGFGKGIIGYIVIQFCLIVVIFILAFIR